MPGRLLSMPREHGAWAMWLIPLATGLATAPAVRPVAHALLGVGFLLAFLSLPAVPRVLHSPGKPKCRRDRLLIGSAVLLAAVLVGPGVLMNSPGPLSLGLLGWQAALAASAILIAESGFGRTLASQVLAVALLTTAAPAAHLAAGDPNLRSVLIIYAVNVLFFLLGTIYVRIRLALRRSRAGASSVQPGIYWLAAIGSTFLALYLLVWSGWLELKLILPFMPLVIHVGVGLVRMSPVNVRRLGLLLLAQSLTFAVTLTLLW